MTTFGRGSLICFGGLRCLGNHVTLGTHHLQACGCILTLLWQRQGLPICCCKTRLYVPTLICLRMRRHLGASWTCDWAHGEFRPHLIPMAQLPWSQWSPRCQGMTELFRKKWKPDFWNNSWVWRVWVVSYVSVSAFRHQISGCILFSSYLIFEVEIPQNHNGPKAKYGCQEDGIAQEFGR